MTDRPDFRACDFYALERWFLGEFGIGFKARTVDGVTIEKDGMQYRSNSGKSADWRLWYTITFPDGSTRRLEKESGYQDNRRNDEGRDWGLPS